MVARIVLLVAVGWSGVITQAQDLDSTRRGEQADSSGIFLAPDTVATLPSPEDCSSDKVPCGDRLLGPDKALHLGASFLGTISLQYVLTSKGQMSEGAALPISATTALSAGLIKELIDANREQDPHFSWKDLTADAVGILLAIGLISL